MTGFSGFTGLSSCSPHHARAKVTGSRGYTKEIPVNPDNPVHPVHLVRFQNVSFSANWMTRWPPEPMRGLPAATSGVRENVPNDGDRRFVSGNAKFG